MVKSVARTDAIAQNPWETSRAADTLQRLSPNSTRWGRSTRSLFRMQTPGRPGQLNPNLTTPNGSELRLHLLVRQFILHGF